MRSLVSAMVVAGTASGAAVLPSDGPAEAREGPVSVPSFHHRRRRGMDLSRWTLRFVPAGAGAGAKRVPHSRADGDASCVAADGLDVGARPAAAALERRYLEQTALSSAVSARVASILLLLENIVIAFTVPKDPRFGLIPWIQLAVSAPFQLALFGASFSRAALPRLFEPLVSLSVLSFSISQRFLFEILVVHNVAIGGDRCAYHTAIICVIMLWLACTYSNLRFHVSVIVSLLLVLESFLPIPLVLGLGLPGSPCLSLEQHGTCALSGVLAVAASYLRERGERRLFLQVLAAERRTSPLPVSNPSETREPAPLQSLNPFRRTALQASAGGDSADEERPAERAAPAPAGDTPRHSGGSPRRVSFGSGSGSGSRALATEAGPRRTSGGADRSSGRSSSFASLRALRLTPSGIVPEWSAGGSTPGPDTPSSRDPLTGPEGGTGNSAAVWPEGSHEEAARVAPRGRLRRLLRWLVAGSPFPSPEAERGYQIFYCYRAWSRVRFLSAPLLLVYLGSLATAAGFGASRAKVSFLDYVRARSPDWILEFVLCGGVFMAGTIMLHARPARLVPFVAFFTTGACLVGQMAALTSLRRFENIAPYLVEAWAKVSLYITFTMISSTFWVPPRAFLLASCVSLPYGLYALSPRDPTISGRIVDMAGFVLSPVAVCLVVCLRQERKLRTLFLLHAPWADHEGPGGDHDHDAGVRIRESSFGSSSLIVNPESELQRPGPRAPTSPRAPAPAPTLSPRSAAAAAPAPAPAAVPAVVPTIFTSPPSAVNVRSLAVDR
eukprot:tig00000523_g1864.t1